MSRRSVAYHRHCGERVVPFIGVGGVSPYCPRHGKILGGPDVYRVNKRTGKVIRADRQTPEGTRRD